MSASTRDNRAAGGASGLELWGGVECTCNRVRDAFFDQLSRSGHDARESDLDRFAGLGIKALRYPVLWERTARGPRRSDLSFAWSDGRLAILRSEGIRPIVGLVHHGSGPAWTSLVDPEMPEKLAEYARAVAERYPWVTDFTPVNEPVTTARFSGLYGHWYPHGRSAEVFVRALLAECRATALAMRAIREITPSARLVQTEDLGRTYSTPLLAYQARHENQRRLLSLDLLCGLVDDRHPLHRYLQKTGASASELAWFCENPCPPDVVGVNYYVTSDRFLDERVERYPAWTRGGNGHHAYADVEAVRVRGEGMTGHTDLLLELWRRYRRPLAVTEAHLGGGREEQVRWFLEAWRGALAAREKGADVRAVTAWSLLGAFDWDSLVVCCRGTYEPGAFDVRSEPPRPTAVARVLRDLAAGREIRHPIAAAPGWWHRPQRLLYPVTSAPALLEIGGDRPGIEPRRAAEETSRVEASSPPPPAVNASPILIAGATGTLGRAFARMCALRGLPHRLLGRKEMDIADPGSVRAALLRCSPWVVVNAAGYVRVDEAEHERARCARENIRGAAALAAACAEQGIQLVTFSSDLVFGGDQRRPYVEDDRVGPLGVYGESKAAAEREVRRIHPSSLVVRSSGFFGPWGGADFVNDAWTSLSEGRPFRAASDAVVSPTYLPDLVNAALDLAIDGEKGLWHLTNRGALSWADLARSIARFAGADPSAVVACPWRTLGLLAPRPSYSALGSRRGLLLPELEESLSRCARERDGARPREAAA